MWLAPSAGGVEGPLVEAIAPTGTAALLAVETPPAEGLVSAG
jgi:hypothetical protein